MAVVTGHRMSEFKLGDVVQLMSDFLGNKEARDYRMTVAGIHDVDGRPGEPDVEVVYRDNAGCISSAVLPPCVLQPYEKNPKVKKP